jgi:monoamine oxidase
MSRSQSFRNLLRAMQVVRSCEERQLSTPEAIARLAASETRAAERRFGRREFLAGAGKLAALGAAGTAIVPMRRALAAQPPSVNVGIVGAGLAGLACADELKGKGVLATIYEAGTRFGGRCFSLGGAFPGPVEFPGQVAERGGEFIDTAHKTMLGYAQKLDLAREDVGKEPGEIFYFFDGQLHPESKVVDEYRALVAAMRDDLRTIGQPTADSYTPAEVALDNTSLEEYLDTRGAGPIAKAAITEAYVAEYGLEPSGQSCLSFLLFIHADRRSKFTPFGVSSDERYHLIGGNEQIPAGLARRLAGQLRPEMKLIRVRKTAAERIELTFENGSRTISRVHDAVVLALPFSTLRDVTLEASLALPDWKLFAIQELRYGTNAKMMVGFATRQQRQLVLGPGEPPDDLGDEPIPGDHHPRDPDGLFGRGPGRAPRPEQRAAGGLALLAGPGLGLSGSSGCRDPGRTGSVPGAPGALALEPAVKGQLHGEPSRLLHDHRRKRSQACWQPVLCRRAHQLVLRVAGVHGGRCALGPAGGCRDTA